MYLVEILFPFPLGIYPEMELLDHVVELIFNILRNFHIIFHSGWTNVHFHQQCISVLFSPHPHQHLLSLVFLRIAILTGGFGIKVMLAERMSLEMFPPPQYLEDFEKDHCYFFKCLVEFSSEATWSWSFLC